METCSPFCARPQATSALENGYWTELNGQTTSIPAIVDRETWERVQAQRAQNKALAKRNAKRDYLLRGMIHCGLCGYYYAGNSICKNRLGAWIRYYRDEVV